MNNDRLIAEQAAQWLHRVTTGGLHEREGFADWLLESRRHVRHALLSLAVEKELKHLDIKGLVDVDALLADAASDVIALEPHFTSTACPSPQRRQQLWRWGFSSVAVLSVIAIGLYWMFRAPVFSTGIGQQQSVKLDDGSVVHLNTQSKIKVVFSDRERNVRLLTGEALFSIESDPARPFRVYADKAVVQALGTQFNVDRHASTVTVAVIQGSVKVSSNEGAEKVMTAGAEARITPDRRIEERPSSNIQRRIAWRERRLEFQEDPLSVAVAEFNRYNRTPRFRIEGAEVAERTYTGIFSADDPESLAQVLSQEEDLVLERTAAEIIIRTR